MVGYLQPLAHNFAIVNELGYPTEYFIRWAQQKQIDIGEAVDEARALEIVKTFLTEHPLQAGSGIDLTPDGDLNNSPTISAKAQEILDQIATTQGSVLFRGAAGWEPLPPGTSTQYLKSGGPSSNPVWQTPAGGGGGGGWSEVFSWSFATDGAASSLIVPLSGYSDIVVEGQEVSCSTSAWRVGRFSTDGGITYHTDCPWTITDAGVVSTRTDLALYFHGTAATAARTWFFSASGINIPGAFKEIKSIRATTSGYYGLSSTSSLGAITHIQLFPATTGAVPSGTFNGGMIKVLAR